ncbi:uncharacterized protein LOC129310565 [Prosopis cineraria]|uniref:uncharacterized protein LOC129310565 n=1 Tax=Prosopis cineraria TaxID=364024 RepID=UPI00240F15F3|nr:uncharacterized protein LOC129310565 [Prosopis cineraria]
MALTFPLLLCKTSKLRTPSSFLASSSSSSSVQYAHIFSPTRSRQFNSYSDANVYTKRRGIVCGLPLPVDPWVPSIDSQSIASQLFAISLLPYIGFLYFITKSKSSPKLTLFGFYFLLAFVGATIPAGIYAKVHYGTSLSNVDWLHGGAESLLTLTNLFIVLGLREGLRNAENSEANEATSDPEFEEEKKSHVYV